MAVNISFEKAADGTGVMKARTLASMNMSFLLFCVEWITARSPPDTDSKEKGGGSLVKTSQLKFQSQIFKEPGAPPDLKVLRALYGVNFIKRQK